MLTENTHFNHNLRSFCYPRPKSFADLMQMYEINYIKLRLLCGDIRLLEGSMTSIIEHALPLQIVALEQARHTSIIQLTYVFEDEVKKPDLQIRVYHDSRQAEVISRRCHLTGSLKQAHTASSQQRLLLERWRLNRFLYKWVNYLHYQGHRFDLES